MIRRIHNREILCGTRGQPHELLVKAWGIPGASNLDRHVLVPPGCGGRRGVTRREAADACEHAPFQIDDHRVTLFDRSVVDRFVTRRPFAKPSEGLLGIGRLHGDRWPAQGDRTVIAGVDRRHRLEEGAKLERLALLDDHVLNVWRVHRLETSFPERFVHGTRNQVLGDIMQDLVTEALPDQLCWDLARTESGNARRATVTSGEPVDLGVDDRTRDLDDEVLARVAEFEALCLHLKYRPDGGFA